MLLMGKLTMSMAIFSIAIYVCLPEDTGFMKPIFFAQLPVVFPLHHGFPKAPVQRRAVPTSAPTLWLRRPTWDLRLGLWDAG